MFKRLVVGSRLGCRPAQYARKEVEAQVATAMAQLQGVTQRIQALTADNAVVREEIADLQRQLAQKSATQSA